MNNSSRKSILEKRIARLERLTAKNESYPRSGETLGEVVAKLVGNNNPSNVRAVLRDVKSMTDLHYIIADEIGLSDENQAIAWMADRWDDPCRIRVNLGQGGGGSDEVQITVDGETFSVDWVDEDEDMEDEDMDEDWDEDEDMEEDEDMYESCNRRRSAKRRKDERIFDFLRKKSKEPEVADVETIARAIADHLEENTKLTVKSVASTTRNKPVCRVTFDKLFGTELNLYVKLTDAERNDLDIILQDKFNTDVFRDEVSGMTDPDKIYKSIRKKLNNTISEYNSDLK